MDDVHAARDASKADVAVLIVADRANCGYASVYASAARAFSVVSENCATGYFSFVHEIGHNAGNLHNPEATSNMRPYRFGHGSLFPGRRERTVMSYDSDDDCCVRRPQFSRPTHWGDQTLRHNARVWNMRAAVLAGFR